VFDDIESLSKEIDAVSIVSPTSLHLESATPFLQKGVHMMLEKPIAPSVEEGQKIVEMAESNNAILQIGHLERFNAGVMALAERVSSPKFIEAHRMGEFVARATDVDVVSDLMIHDIDIILSLVNSELTDISANGLSVLTDHIDIANARLEFENGAVANVTASRVSNKTLRRIRLFEQNRYDSLDFIAQNLETVHAQPKAGEEWPEIIKEDIKIEPVQPLNVELAEFITSVQTGKAPLVGGRVGLKALSVAIQIKEAIGK
jgi:predicted dehydrogenase